VVRDRCEWGGRESYSARVSRQCRDSKLQQCERHKSVAPMQDGIERCATVQDVGSCCSSAEVRDREHLSVIEGASTSVGVSSPTGRSVGRSVTYFLVTKLQCNSG